MPDIKISGADTKGTVVGFDTQEWYVIGDGSAGVNPVNNNITLWHKQDDEPEEGLYNNYYGWSNIREYVFLTPNGSNEPVKESDPDDKDFPEFQEYEGIKLALFWTPNHNYGGEGKPMLIRPSLESGVNDRSRALYFAVDHNDTSEGKGFTNPIDYHGGSLQQMMEKIVSEMRPKESALLTPRTIDLGEKGGKPTENQKFWPLSQDDYKIIASSKAAGYFEYYWLLAPSMSNDDYGYVRLPVVVTDYNIVIENSLYDAHDDGDGIGKQSGPVRPACNLNLENAWFATAASGDNGKQSNVISFTSFDALQSADRLLKDGDPIKFTMKDETQTLTVENAEIAVDAQGNGTVKYSNAATGKNQYISCFIMDGDNVLYYGKLADCSASGTGEIRITAPAELINDTYTMYLFSEQDNGDNLTDFAGELIPITFTQAQSHTVSYDLNGGTGKDGVSYAPETVKQGATVTIKDAPSKSGYTFEGWNDGTTTHQPGAVLTVTSNITLTAQWHKNSSGGGDGGGDTYYILHYESNGGTEYKDERYKKNTVVKLDKVPTREGYTFTGWYSDEELIDRITSIKMTGDKTVYAGWEPTGVPDWLNGKDHFAYVVGYVDGTVRPLNNISRAEVATIFFRLLNEDIREENLTSTNTFSDVNDGMWCNTAISTMAKLGVVKGRTAERFDPNAPITRAEFAAICARFDTSKRDGDSNFTDISGHWAEAEIERAASLGWIMGYTDGTFRPENYITRAEAMTMINRVLNRLPEDEDDLLDGMNVWPDNQPSAWYYLAVQEATNSHDFTRKGDVHERWTKLNADPDWTQYQK